MRPLLRQLSDACSIMACPAGGQSIKKEKQRIYYYFRLCQKKKKPIISHRERVQCYIHLTAIYYTTSQYCSTLPSVFSSCLNLPDSSKNKIKVRIWNSAGKTYLFFAWLLAVRLRWYGHVHENAKLNNAKWRCNSYNWKKKRRERICKIWRDEIEEDLSTMRTKTGR